MKKNGRPKASERLGINLKREEELHRLKTLCELGLTQKEIASSYMVSLSTFKRIFKEQLGKEYGTFEPFFKKHSRELNLSFRRDLVKQSKEGSTAATIYGLKITGTLEEKDKQMIELKKQELDIKRKQMDKAKEMPNITLDATDYESAILEHGGLVDEDLL